MPSEFFSEEFFYLSCLDWSISNWRNFCYNHVLWKLLKSMQTVQILIRRRVLRCLICVCTVCKCLFYATLGINWLMQTVKALIHYVVTLRLAESHKNLMRTAHNLISLLALEPQYEQRRPWSDCLCTGCADLSLVIANVITNFVAISHFITKTCLYDIDPLKPHFYIVKLGFTGVYIIFLISAPKHRLWVLVRTASPRRF